jgi:hypothetical protein
VSDEYPADYHSPLQGWKPWRIAEDIEISGCPIGFMNGRYIVDDVEESGDTTTYRLVRPWDGTPQWGQWGDLL